MSLFLQNQPDADQIIVPSHLKANFYKDQNLNEMQSNIDDNIETELKRIKQLNIISNFIKQQTLLQTKYVFIITQTLQPFRILMKITSNKNTKNICFKFNLLSREDIVFKIKNKNGFIQAYRMMENYLTAHQISFLKLTINSESGEVCIQLPIISTIYNSIFSKRFSIESQSKIQIIYLHYLQEFCPELKIIANINNETLSNNPTKTSIVQNISKYMHMMTIKTDSNTFQSEELIKINIQKTLDKLVIFEKDYKRIGSLFNHKYQYEALLLQKKRNYLISQCELKLILELNSKPNQIKSKNPHENPMILNYISIHQIDKVKTQKIGEGGFAQIHVASIFYSYVYSSEGHKHLFKNQSQNNLIQKIVILKKQISKQTHYIKKQHEINIIKKIKGGNSFYLPKYYIAINQPNPFQDSVIMDYIPFNNLKGYMQSRSSSISLSTKLRLFLSLAQALRYIKDYKIVHLDIKPSNIMIFCNLLIKLIDFGESYHPDICSRYRNKKKNQKLDYMPGYTIPYSSPEVYNCQNMPFSSKSDVFSFGVVMFQILYKELPYDTSLTDEYKIGRMMQDQVYLNKWMFSPEEYEQYGEIHVLRVMNHVISRCLSKLPENRPQLDWIALIVKQCITFLH